MYYPWYHRPVCRHVIHGYPHTCSYYYQIPQSRENEYPPADPTILSQSVEEYQVLIQQGEILLNKLSNTTYARELMEAAQQGHQAEVDRLIQSIEGLHVPVQTEYTPSGAIFNLQSPAVSEGAECCTLNITLKWGK